MSTARKAKGREWDHAVFLDHFEPPAELAARRQSDPKRAEDTDQQIDLLYVACTRAMRQLHLATRLCEALNWSVVDVRQKMTPTRLRPPFCWERQ